MRLKTEEVHAIKSAVREVFGERISVYLFGSRVENEKKGGDIDLYLELPAERYRSMQKHLFRARLSESLGEQKIDIIINQIGRSKVLPIYDIAKKSGILL